MCTVIRISSSRCGFPHLFAAPANIPLLFDRFNPGLWGYVELADDPLAVLARDVEDMFGDLSYHFLGLGGFSPLPLLGDKPRKLDSPRLPPLK